MKGNDLINEFEKRLKKRYGAGQVTERVIADALGVTVAGLAKYRTGILTPRQMANLSISFARAQRESVVKSTVIPVAEFFPIEQYVTAGGKRQLFSTGDKSGEVHPYLSGLRQKLESTHGIYVFHDSRGRSIYAGKAHKLSLWTEMNNAFNRNRKEVQSIKRVSHPTNRVKYRGHEEKTRQIVRQQVPLYGIAAYFSAFEVPGILIGKFEALIVRAFANDLLNVRMEKI
ncbi:hypothetical protein [Pseudoxanthomonas sp. X-1]|uniref:hypothetical protein n=1 Tax=Pseudoxanthomonas sp. X-1 TaxID=2571115 RepID=UPI00110AF4CE|nr:hypothetical protein [Pseudoxanthomonas sp. X-1]TMN19671.1 hypothetical protein FF950_10695 [Pseudoxanthomonas sp. X-1]UAY74334.1 hypothetical protein LAJ50_18045 [Pseudoxanthomonas sp. X-1]